MRVLVIAVVPSHFLPMVPIAWALRAAGHEVLVAGKADITSTARAAGLCTAEVTEADPELEARRRAGSSNVRSGHTGPPSWDALADNWRARAGNVIDSHLAAARTFRPDVVLSDPIEFCGLLVAAALGIPCVTHRWGPEELTSQALPHALDALAGLSERIGAGDALAGPAMILDPCPPSLQAPGASPATPVRFVPFNGTGSLPRWDGPPRRRICLSLGMFGFSVLAGDGGTTVLESLAARLAGRRDLDVVLPVPAAHAERLRELPAPVRVVGQVPLSSFLGDCELVVHHGGSGTALTAASFGLPQLLLPQEHPALASCAERLFDRGVAREAGEDLGATIDEVLADGLCAENARSLRDELTALPSPADIVPMLAALAA